MTSSWRALRAFIVMLASALAVNVAAAQANGGGVTLTVSPDRADWLYRVGDTVAFTVGLTRSGRPVQGVKVSVDVGPERMPSLRRDTLVSGHGDRVVKGTLGQPGFLRATATAIVDGVTYRGMATAGFSPERITASTTSPGDFEAFWRSTVAAARLVPLAPVMTRMAGRSTASVDVYHVSFQNDRAGSRLYGILSIPKRPGKFPAVLGVPGAGVRPYFPDTALAKLGVIHLRIGIHGIPVDRDSLLYNELRATALSRYWMYGIESRETYYYRRVYAGVVRAGDFVFDLPQFDGMNYVVQGGSQGGALAIVAGVLDDRVRAISVAHPALGDHFAYFEGRPGGWPHFFADTAGMRAIAEKMETLRYYDVVNFARMLRVPGFYTWGYNDNTVPPTSSYSVYNVVMAPKEMLIAPEAGHFTVRAQDDRARAWVLDKLMAATR